MSPVSEREASSSEEDVDSEDASSLTPTAQMLVAQKPKFLVHEVVVRSGEKHNFRCPLKSPLLLIR
jgi:hypothetical protein